MWQKNRCRCRIWRSGPANASVNDHRIRLDDLPALRGLQRKPCFPKIKSEYIDTGKIRYIFREFPLDIKAGPPARMLSRCIAKDDAAKYFRGSPTCCSGSRATG